MLLKHFGRRDKQTTSVAIGALRVKYARKKMQIDHERVLEIGILLDLLTITHFYRNGFYIFCVFGETTFTCFYLYVNDLA